MNMDVSINFGADSELDTFVRGLYDTRIKFRIPDHEATNIQTGVETIVSGLVKRTLSSSHYAKYVSGIASTKYQEETGCVAYMEDSTHCLSNQSGKWLKSCPEQDVLKVGSYYEGTRNTYPDEYDYISVIGVCNSVTDFRTHKVVLLHGFHEALRKTLDEHPFGLCFGNVRFSKVIRLSGPSSKLELIYTPGHGKERALDVDISPAIRITDPTKNLNPKHFKYIDWYYRVLDQGSCLQMLIYKREGGMKDLRISISESEIKYIRFKLSANHKRVYQLLKYMINGHEGNEKLRNLLFNSSVLNLATTEIRVSSVMEYNICSYMLKTLIYHHAHECNSQPPVGTCLVSLVADLLAVLQRPEDHISLHTILNVKLTLIHVDGKGDFLYFFSKLLKPTKCILANLLRHLQQMRARPTTSYSGSIQFRPMAACMVRVLNFELSIGFAGMILYLTRFVVISWIQHVFTFNEYKLGFPKFVVACLIIFLASLTGLFMLANKRVCLTERLFAWCLDPFPTREIGMVAQSTVLVVVVGFVAALLYYALPF